MKLLLAALMASAHLAGLAPAVDGLLADSAADFKAHAPHPADVRQVYAGTLNEEGRSMPLICGQFLPPGPDAAWTPFVTIKTSGYEQWLGGQAEGLCGKANLDRDAELTLMLKAKIGL